MTTKVAIDRREVLEMSNTINYLIRDIVVRMADCDESALGYVNVSGLDLRCYLRSAIIKNLESISIRYTGKESSLTVPDAVLFGKLCEKRQHLESLTYLSLVYMYRDSHALQMRSEERYFAIDNTSADHVRPTATNTN